MLIDGGAEPQLLERELGRRLPFWDRGIDLVIATYPHQDHLTGLVEVLRRHSVHQVMDNGFKSSSLVALSWRQVIQDKKVPYLRAHAGQVISLSEGLTVEVLHPPPQPLQGTASDTGNNSIVLRLRYKEVSLLFTGDLRREGERFLLESGVPLSATVLKVAGHGREGASSEEFLSSVGPQLAVLTGAGRPGVPHPAVLERLLKRIPANGLFPLQQGDWLELVTDGHRIWMKPQE